MILSGKQATDSYNLLVTGIVKSRCDGFAVIISIVIQAIGNRNRTHRRYRFTVRVSGVMSIDIVFMRLHLDI